MYYLKIKDNNEEKELAISKENAIFVIDKLRFVEFYSYFYKVLKRKEKEPSIYLGNKLLESKSVNLFAFMDISAILDELTFKKGTLLYEYLVSCLRLEDVLDTDILLYDVVNIVKNIIQNSELEINYELNEDVEKLIFSLVDFQINYSIQEMIPLFLKLLRNFLEKNNHKINIIFYDSDLINCDVSHYDSCYLFDVSNKLNFYEYNMICWNSINEFSFEMILEKLESMWPVEFKKEEVEENVKKYFRKKGFNLDNEILSETDVIVISILNKLFEQPNDKFEDSIMIRDNVKSFLEHI